ncbi:MAG: hypothetical protein ACYS6K_20870, partial [Planctomycetota bacterium]
LLPVSELLSTVMSCSLPQIQARVVRFCFAVWKQSFILAISVDVWCSSCIIRVDWSGQAGSFT